MVNEEKTLHIGSKSDAPFSLPLANLNKHAIALGSSGSGKTVFTKTIIEEAILKDIPSLVFDVQGDLCSLALFGTKKEREEHDLDEEIASVLKEKMDVTIYTPVSSKGISVCINPLKLPQANLPQEEAITLIHDTATTLTKLLGASLRTSKGKYTQAVLYSTLYYSYSHQESISTFSHLIHMLRHPPEGLKEEIAEFLEEKKSLDFLIKQLKYLTIGQKKLLFQFGVASSVDMFFGKNKFKQKTTPISIMYLNTLGSQEEKEYYVANIANLLYQWMLDNPSEEVQGLFVLDEIAPFLPAGSEKPVCKPMLKLLFKQARKYGISCVIATQNPGDIDYKAFSQFGTWAIGRLNLKQDIKKVKQALKSLTSDVDLEATLPKLKTGEFLLYAPDSFDSLQKFKTRWLYTKHKTLTEKDIERLMRPKQEAYLPFHVKEVDLTEVKTKLVEELGEEEPSSINENTEPIAVKDVPKTKQKLEVYQTKGLHEQVIRELALKKRKKRFGVIGEHTTQLLHLERSDRVMYCMSVRQIKKWFGGLFKSTRDTTIVMDAITGHIVLLSQGKRKVMTESDKIVQLQETETRLARELHLTKESYRSEEELRQATAYPKQTITKTLHSLEKKNIIAHEKVGKYKRWFGVLQFKEHRPRRLSSNIEIEKSTQQAPKTSISEEQVRSFVRHWFKSASVRSLHLLLVPQYLATYSDDDRKITKITLDGITGMEIEE